MSRPSPRRSALRIATRCPVLLLLLVGLFALPVQAASGPAEREEAPAEASAPNPGFWLGDEYRYGQAGLLERAARDLVAIPAGITRWDGRDWGIFLSLTTVVVGMMFPYDHSADLYFQDAARNGLGPWRLATWTPITDVSVWGGIGIAMGTTFLIGHLKDRPELLEVTSLMSEAFILGQVYQLVFKLLLGREGPENGEGKGIIRGPLWGWKLFPSGTPSGHASTFFALMGALNTYVDNPALTLAMVPVGLVFAFTLVISDYHFASDVVWGAAMGYALGSWVVRHRRSAPGTLERPDNLMQWLVTPWFDGRKGAAGGALTLVF